MSDWQILAEAVNIATIQELFLPMIAQLVEDPIPNIRFNVAKSYGELITVLRQLPADGALSSLKPDANGGPPAGPTPLALELITKEILPKLEKLRQDEDVDVRYFAEIAGQKGQDLMAP